MTLASHKSPAREIFVLRIEVRPGLLPRAVLEFIDCRIFWKILMDIRSGQVRCGGIRRSSASPRPPYDGTPSASVWPSPRQTPGPSCPYHPGRIPLDAITKHAGGPSAWSSPSDPDRRESSTESSHMPIQAWLALSMYSKFPN